MKPGKWHVKTYTRETGRKYVPKQGDFAGVEKKEIEYVYFVCPGDSRRIEINNLHTAHMVAAAPEMYEFLKELLNRFDISNDDKLKIKALIGRILDEKT